MICITIRLNRIVEEIPTAEEIRAVVETRNAEAEIAAVLRQHPAAARVPKAQEAQWVLWGQWDPKVHKGR